MSAYEPPSEIDPIFNSLAFQTPNDASLTISEGDERYLARKNIATSEASVTQFTGNIQLTKAVGPLISSTIDDLSLQSPSGKSMVFYVGGGVTSVNFGSTGIITVPNTLRSVNSGVGIGLTIQNQGTNPGGFILTNTNTASDITISQSGTRSVITQVNGITQVTTTSTATTFVGDIILRTTQPTNTAGYLGYTVKQNGNNTAAITSGVAYNLNGTGLSITPGVYIFNIMVNNSKTAAGDLNVMQVGISTNSANFVGGATTLTNGFQTYTGATAQDVIGNATFTFSVPTTATYYLLQQLSHTMTIIGTVNSYWQYTRVA